jgi:hypothetical protein
MRLAGDAQPLCGFSRADGLFRPCSSRANAREHPDQLLQLFARTRHAHLHDQGVSDRYNFAPSRLSAAGYAEFHPVAENTSTDGRARNRRVDIVILNPTSSELIPPPLSSPQATSSSPVSAPKTASSPKQPTGP